MNLLSTMMAIPGFNSVTIPDCLKTSQSLMDPAWPWTWCESPHSDGAERMVSDRISPPRFFSWDSCAIKNDLCVRKSCKLRWQVSSHYLWRNPETLPSQQAVQEMGPCRDDTTCSGIWMNVEPLCQVYKGETHWRVSEIAEPFLWVSFPVKI